jgi:hypothetical protein
VGVLLSLSLMSMKILFHTCFLRESTSVRDDGNTMYGGMLKFGISVRTTHSHKNGGSSKSWSMNYCRLLVSMTL